MIGDNIEVTIVDIRGDKVRLGITAPNTIPVHRKEVYDAIVRENSEAARSKLEDRLRPSQKGRPPVPNPLKTAEQNPPPKPGFRPPRPAEQSAPPEPPKIP